MNEDKSVVEESVTHTPYVETDEKKIKRAKLLAIWDKVTTGILIFLMASPFLILLYIFMWFINK